MNPIFVLPALDILGPLLMFEQGVNSLQIVVHLLIGLCRQWIRDSRSKAHVKFTQHRNNIYNKIDIILSMQSKCSILPKNPSFFSKQKL